MSASTNSVHDWLEGKVKGHARLSVSPDTSRPWKPLHKVRSEIYEQLRGAVNCSAVLSNSQRRTVEAAVEAAVERASLLSENKSDQTAWVLRIAAFINSCR